jgi:hypothetical protein
VFWVSLQLFAVVIVVQAHQIHRSSFEMHPLQLMQLVWSNLQKLFLNASIATHATCLIKFTEVILKCIHCNSWNLSGQIYRSYFEMHPLQLMQLVWSNLLKSFWNVSIITHATCLIKFTEVILNCMHCNSCNLSDQIYRSYFEMHPLQLMPLVWSNLQKLFWNASVATAHGHKKQRKVSFWKKNYTRTCRMKAQSISFLKIKKPLLNFEVLKKHLEANIKVYKVCNLHSWSVLTPSTAPKTVILKLRSYVCAQEKEEKHKE